MGKAIRKPSGPNQPFELTLGEMPLGPRLVVDPGESPREHPAKKTSAVLIKAVMFPMPPTVNSYWRTRVLKMKNPSFKQLRMNGGYMAMGYISKDAQRYKETIKLRVAEKGLNFMSEAILEAHILVCPATNARMDLDNRIKPLFDALKDGGVFKDDSQIWKHTVERGPIIKGGRVVVSINEVMHDVQEAMVRSGWVGK